MTFDHSVSIICGVKDRAEHLFKVLPTWLVLPEVAEIIIVDWSSKERLYFPRESLVTVVRVEGEELWQPGPCFNLALQVATKPYVLKLDVDVAVKDSAFFRAHPVLPNVFYAGDHYKADDENEAHLSGIVYAKLSDLLSVNGYNERMTTYGYDDDDLYERLQLAGLSRHTVNHKAFYHIPHSNAIRLQHQPKRILNVYKEAEFNCSLARDNPWGRNDKVIQWVIKPQGERRYICRRSNDGWVETTWQKEGPRNVPVFTKDMFTGSVITGPGNWKTHVLPLLKNTSPIHWIEVGSYEGMSALWTVDNILKDRPGSTITCIDSWMAQWITRDEVIEKAFDYNVQGIPNLVKIRERSHRVLSSLRTRYHGIYIDGSHLECDVYLDATLGLQLLVPGAVMIFDDYEASMPDGSPVGKLQFGVQPAVDRFLAENKERLRVVYRGWQMILQVIK